LFFQEKYAGTETERRGFHADQQALPGLPLVEGAHRVRSPGTDAVLPLPGGYPKKVRSV
jgi:hypothetical protein